MVLTRNVVYVGLLLAFAAGFCDAATFTAAGQLFSAHVTGNFILFAYDLVRGGGAEAWAKLISFPVFVAAVTMAGSIAPRLKNEYRLLFIEGVILVGSGAVSMLLHFLGVMVPWWNAGFPFVVVWAMGIQNAFGRIYSKSGYAQTTVMTGNVTQLTLNLSKRLRTKGGEPSMQDVSGQAALVGIFLAGCVLGAVGASALGLWTVVLPGGLLVGLGVQR